MGKKLKGRFLLQIDSVRNGGKEDGTGTDRYNATVIANANVDVGSQVTVRFKRYKKLPGRYIGMTGVFDGDENDIQSDPQNNIESRSGTHSFQNPFETFDNFHFENVAIDSKGNQVNANDVGPGNYFCIQCKDKVHWRHPIGKKPHFYHWQWNSDCPLCSEERGEWNHDHKELKKIFTKYKDRWQETMEDLVEYYLLYLLEGKGWAYNPIKRHIEYLENLSDKDNYSDIYILKELLKTIEEEVVDPPLTKFKDVLEIQSGTTVIKEFEFENRADIQKVILPDSLEEIGQYAFRCCRNLEEINLPKNLQKISLYAFSECEKLKEINIPDGIKEIDIAVFNRCYSLEKITIPSSVVSIKEWAFANCKCLNGVIIPKDVTCLNYHTFWNCEKLVDIDIPKDLKEIFISTFEGSNNINKNVRENIITKFGQDPFIELKRGIV